MNDIAIPKFLDRRNPEGEPAMRPSDTQAAKSEPASAGQEKRTRNITPLPTALSDGSVVADLTFDELVEKRAIWETKVACHEMEELELRAIRAQIRKKV
jgi:hypothetical protein